jgi:biotin carboxylase
MNWQNENITNCFNIMTTQKRLLILGANPETAGLVKKANEMGHFTIVTDYDPHAYAKQFASIACNVDAMDLDKLVDLAKQEKVDGIVLGVAEALMPTYARVCEALHLPCYGNLELFALLADKARFKNVCRQYNVPVVDEYHMKDYASEDELKRIPLPVVVKPVDSCSSKGISVCKTYNELKNGIVKALSFSRSKKLIIEKYMTGEEVVIYYAIQDGEVSLVAMCDRYTNKEQAGVAQLPTAYVYPSRHLDKYLSEVNGMVKRMLEGIGMKNGVLFIQSFIDENGGVRFYEPGYRLNGAQEHFLVNAATGIDGRELLINLALTGQESTRRIAELADPRFHGKFGCKLSPLVREGKISRIVGLTEIAEMPDLISVNPNYRDGDVVTGYGTLRQIACRFFLMGRSRKELRDRIQSVYDKFDVLDEKGESMLLRRFDVNLI